MQKNLLLFCKNPLTNGFSYGIVCLANQRWPLSQTVKTSPSHGEDRSSILLVVTMDRILRYPIFFCSLGVYAKKPKINLRILKKRVDKTKKLCYNSPVANEQPNSWTDGRVGLRRTTGNRVTVNPVLGFESLSVRQKKALA